MNYNQKLKFIFINYFKIKKTKIISSIKYFET